MEAADRSLDQEDQEMSDWKFLSSYTISERYLNVLTQLSELPGCFGTLFKKVLFNKFSLSYDIIINFIEGHEESIKLIQSIIENEEFVGKIVKECYVNVQAAEKYQQSYIEDIFPEITKSIQHRRAQYYLLTHEYHYIDKMLKHG